MKKLLSILFALLCCLGAALADGDEYWTTKDDPHYHAERTCGGTAEMRPISPAGAREFQKYPCPRCVQPGTTTCGPAWCADPATYNSQMDAYRNSSAILAGDSVYFFEFYLENGDFAHGKPGELLMRMDANGDASTTELVCDLGVGASVAGAFDLGDGFLYVHTESGAVHRMDYDGKNDRVLFTVDGNLRLPFAVLVNDRLYCAVDRTIGYYAIPDGGFTALHTIPASTAWGWQGIYAEGTLFVRYFADDYALLAIDTATGTCVDLAKRTGFETPFAILAVNGRLCFTNASGELFSANYDGSDVRSIEKAHEDSIYSFNRAYDRYIFVTDGSYLPGEYIFIAAQDGELHFDPPEMDRAVNTLTPMYFLGDRVYIRSDSARLPGHPDVLLYNSRDLREYVLELLANPPEESRNTGF